MSDYNITNEPRYWEIIEELATRGYREVREIEHDIIDRELFCPDLPIMEFIINKHKITPDQYSVIAECVHQHLCSNTILKNIES
jgi:hypothetical protein